MPGWSPPTYLLRQPSPADSSRVFIYDLIVDVNASWMFYPQYIVVFADLTPYIYSKTY